MNTNDVLYLIINLPNFEKTAKRYYDKYKMLDEYTGVQSIRMDRVIASGESKTYADIILEKDKHYKTYLYYIGKVNDIYNMLDVLNDLEKEIILDWYTTPKQFRKTADAFAKEKNISRRTFFDYKKEALIKLVEFNK